MPTRGQRRLSQQTGWATAKPTTCREGCDPAGTPAPAVHRGRRTPRDETQREHLSGPAAPGCPRAEAIAGAPSNRAMPMPELTRIEIFATVGAMSSGYLAAARSPIPCPVRTGWRRPGRPRGPSRRPEILLGEDPRQGGCDGDAREAHLQAGRDGARGTATDEPAQGPRPRLIGLVRRSRAAGASAAICCGRGRNRRRHRRVTAHAQRRSHRVDDVLLLATPRPRCSGRDRISPATRSATRNAPGSCLSDANASVRCSSVG